MFPIYQQNTEPVNKYGIWIKTNEKTDNIYFQTDDVREPKEINDLPYSFTDYSRATSVGSDIYLFGGEENEDDDNLKAYKYDSIEKTYTKLTNIPNPGLENGAVVSTGSDIYLTVLNTIYKYDISTDTYTEIGYVGFTTLDGSAMVLINGIIYIFGSSNSDDNQHTIKYDIENDEETMLKDIPYAFSPGSAVLVNEDEIYLFGVRGTNNSFGLYKYSITENKYSEDRVLIRVNPSNAIINNYVYLLEDFLTYTNFISPIVSKYSIKNNTFYQYDKRTIFINDTKIDIVQIACANNDLYLLSYDKLYKAKIIADYKGDGIYVISQESSLAKDLDVSNILDVKKNSRWRRTRYSSICRRW